jgi:hypothetical protein
MNKTIFSQIMDHASRYQFDYLVKKYQGNKKSHKFSCWDHFLCMSFAQLTYRNSLRDIEICLKAQPKKLLSMGIIGNPTRTNIANANQTRNWRIYADHAQKLISQAKKLYQDDQPFSVELENTVYALDASTIDLCLTLFPWAKFRKTKSAIKLHTLLDIRGSIPSYIEITDGSVHDVNILDELILEPGSYYLMDRAYIDFARLYKINTELCFFVTRAKKNLNFCRVYSAQLDRQSGLICDQIIKLTLAKSANEYPDRLRRIKYYDKETEKTLVFLTNNFEVPPLIIAELYKNRWKIELFFKWIKQHLKIKSFLGTTSNAVKSQIWIAISTYVIIAIIKKRLNIKISLYSMLQIFSLTLFEKIPFHDLFFGEEVKPTLTPTENRQLDFSDFID